MNINAGDTAWVLASAALVMFMTPGLAFFYGGMVRARNVLTMLMQNFFCLGLVSVLWAVVVYSFAFGGTSKWIGNFDFAWLTHFNTSPPGLVLTIPPALYMTYQLMFAVITPALITGAIADRVRFGAWASEEYSCSSSQAAALLIRSSRPSSSRLIAVGSAAISGSPVCW